MHDPITIVYVPVWKLASDDVADNPDAQRFARRTPHHVDVYLHHLPTCLAVCWATARPAHVCTFTCTFPHTHTFKHKKTLSPREASSICGGMNASHAVAAVAGALMNAKNATMRRPSARFLIQ